ncbi:MAG: D-tyrosyl-tRNA(Tyr) deacylase [Clostridiales bacterium]|nr:D-tyrosyl-tRNA(Tyr) deacylase [Clostridiales bacterium]
MRAVVQRVSEAGVTSEGIETGKIGRGFVVLLGVGKEDSEADAEYLADKVVNLRVFEDENNKMNISLKGISGELLVVSQFTLYGDCRRGNRPGFDRAARPEEAERLYEYFVERCRSHQIKVETGRFQTDMEVGLKNDGPVTIMMDSRKEF